ncbi:uncharacterized protein LOC123511950 [Portunus trituberculatus]|uniref:uncharacterized protein LOC123511950 n=1 Tax=Portunus trituberculatus TaxID=210409 RepID=UPI001E1D1BD8|nr:uncharacterized protein LOC123511950 [Portunus trituberculatus]
MARPLHHTTLAERRSSIPSPKKMTEQRRPFQPTELADRARFVSMWVNGKSTRAIARETGTSASTVSRWIKRWKKEGNVDTRPRLGRPCCYKYLDTRDLELLQTFCCDLQQYFRF